MIKVLGKVWITKSAVYITYYIQNKDGDWWKTNTINFNPKQRYRNKRFNIRACFKYCATKIEEKLREPTLTKPGWQKEWEVEDRRIKRMFGL